MYKIPYGTTYLLELPLLNPGNTNIDNAVWRSQIRQSTDQSTEPVASFEVTVSSDGTALFLNLTPSECRKLVVGERYFFDIALIFDAGRIYNLLPGDSQDNNIICIPSYTNNELEVAQ